MGDRSGQHSPLGVRTARGWMPTQGHPGGVAAPYAARRPDPTDHGHDSHGNAAAPRSGPGRQAGCSPGSQAMGCHLRVGSSLTRVAVGGFWAMEKLNLNEDSTGTGRLLTAREL